jgi:aspartate-semialdehyde dehydrogenase
MTGKVSIAVAGATGEVGRACLAMLEEAALPLERLHLLATPASADETVMFNGRPLLVEALADFDFAGADIVVLAVPPAVAAEYAPRAVAAGCRVIDHSPAFRMDESVPLLTDAAGDRLPPAPLVACPGAPAAMLAPVLQALDARFGIAQAHATLLLPVSSAGKAGVRELARQTGELLNGRGIDPAVFPAQMAFNGIPLVGSSAVSDSPVTVAAELERLLGRPLALSLGMTLTPVFYGQLACLTVLCDREADPGDARAVLSAAGFVWADSEQDQGVATSVTDMAGRDGVYLAGLAAVAGPMAGLQLFVMADNVRQGAARHSLHIVENWIKDFKY